MDTDLQRIDLKVFLDAPPNYSLDLDPVLTIFDRWRQETDHPEDWVDLADYAHMHLGPGVMMAGKRAHFAVDTNEPGVGLLYRGRKDFDGAVEERLLEAFRRALRLMTRLVSEPEFPSGLPVRSEDWLVAINDRLGFPNDDATEEQLKPGLLATLDHIFGEGGYQLERDADPQHLYSSRLRADQRRDLNELLEKAGG